MPHHIAQLQHPQLQHLQLQRQRRQFINYLQIRLLKAILRLGPILTWFQMRFGIHLAPVQELCGSVVHLYLLTIHGSIQVIPIIHILLFKAMLVLIFDYVSKVQMVQLLLTRILLGQCLRQLLPLVQLLLQQPQQLVQLQHRRHQPLLQHYP